MEKFFQSKYTELVDSPNQASIWWHSMPLPDGSRINGYHDDKDLQFKMWQAMRIPNHNGLVGKAVLDIGANDGFFSLAAIKAGASKVTSIDKDWATWPLNIEYASEQWGVEPRILTADFRDYDFSEKFDVIFFLGVLYHLEDVFGCMRTLNHLLRDGGVLYIETQMSLIKSDLPIFEYASDIFPTVAIQDKKSLPTVGISNYLFPNDQAVQNLAYSYGFTFESLNDSNNQYTIENPTRKFFRFVKI